MQAYSSLSGASWYAKLFIVTPFSFKGVLVFDTFPQGWQLGVEWCQYPAAAAEKTGSWAYTA